MVVNFGEKLFFFWCNKINIFIDLLLVKLTKNYAHSNAPHAYFLFLENAAADDYARGHMRRNN